MTGAAAAGGAMSAVAGGTAAGAAIHNAGGESSNTDDPLGMADESYKNCPSSNGHWEKNRGDSKWIPDPDYSPPEKSRNPDSPYSNPDGLSWREILEKHKIDGIPFKDGEADFSEVSKGKVEIEQYTSDRDDNFDLADIELARQKGCTPEEVKQWRSDNNYTWHECKDMKTMQKVPNEVHANIWHSGGISESKKGGGK